MFIKQIIIQGFKSYKEQTVMEPFSPGTNVVVGRNGSGKSNFFAAIRFVLGDHYINLNREDRQALLHEGSGSAVMSAYVEIIFDNQDRRFQTQGEEVVIRRTIALKKDEYSLDKKVVTKSEIMDLLEGAGFSKANPYYIVPQGRVTALTNMKESDRLNLLKEIAGTNTYENRRNDSEKIMKETLSKRDKIDEYLVIIQERLDELEEEKDELRQFQEKDKERRCLEYGFYHQQQEKIQLALAEIEDATRGGANNFKQERDAFQKSEKEIEDTGAQISELRQDLESLGIDRTQLDGDRKAAAIARAQAEIKAKSLEDSRDQRVQEQVERDEKLASLNQQIQSGEAELAKIGPQYEKLQTEEKEAKRQVDLADKERLRLETKASRSSQFANKKERDAYLQNQIEESNTSVAHQKAARMDAVETVDIIESSISARKKEVEQVRQKRTSFPADMERLKEALSVAQEEHERLTEKKKELEREREKLNLRHETVASDLRRAVNELSRRVDPPVFRALNAIRELKQREDIPGAYGCLAELLRIPQADTYQVAVEQVAGSRLFHYVVDNEKTASALGDHLYKHKAGRVTFLPLAQIHVSKKNLPRAADAQPLLSKIEYDPRHEVAFQHVFGRTVVCPDLSIGAQYARSHGVEGVTLEGELTDKRGALTGGYINTHKLRITAVQRVMELRSTHDEQLRQIREIRDREVTLTQQITKALGEKRMHETSLDKLTKDYGRLGTDVQNLEQQLLRKQEQLDTAKSKLEQLDAVLQRLDDNITGAQEELKSDFKKTLTAGEEHQLEVLTEQVEEHRRNWNGACKKRRAVETRKKTLEYNLQQSLRPQVEELKSQAIEILAFEGASSDKDAKKELQKAQKAAAKLERQWQQLEANIQDKRKAIRELEGEKEKQEQALQELKARIEKQQKRAEKNIQRKAIFTQQAASLAKSIRDLGVIPEEAFGKYDRMKMEQIESRLTKVNNTLKKFQHINKKALEQYNSFTHQREQLIKRRKELDDARESIIQLIDHLDQAKDEAIERTFKQVSKEFSTIFEQLVPAGHGRLVIQRRADRNKNRNAEESEGEPGGSVQNYTGVGISVSFNSKTFDEQQKIQQLSGGQKSLCALCLIFAIQATETSPMVIFDEVDANLDAQYRTAVAALLESTSKTAGTQFICTTFRPEIVHVADKCYGVTFSHKTSTIDCVPTVDALNFVEGQKR